MVHYEEDRARIVLLQTPDHTYVPTLLSCLYSSNSYFNPGIRSPYCPISEKPDSEPPNRENSRLHYVHYNNGDVEVWDTSKLSYVSLDVASL